MSCNYEMACYFSRMAERTSTSLDTNLHTELLKFRLELTDRRQVRELVDDAVRFYLSHVSSHFRQSEKRKAKAS